MVRRKTAVLTGVVALGALVTTCGGRAPAEDDAPDDPTGNTAQIANPASQYCIDQGGNVEIVDEDAGQVGYCILPGGARVEEWEYFRSSGG